MITYEIGGNEYVTDTAHRPLSILHIFLIVFRLCFEKVEQNDHLHHLDLLSS